MVPVLHTELAGHLNIVLVITLLVMVLMPVQVGVSLVILVTKYVRQQVMPVVMEQAILLVPDVMAV